MTPREDYHLSNVARHNRKATASQQSYELYAAAESPVIKVTVSDIRVLHESWMFEFRQTAYTLYHSPV
ncbi:hypothetical protein TNCV_2445311 [Trichonephila clavipes]|nr:hypothetical protein TNCV_2445311 [Trichonephila clavipes]